MSFRSLSIGIKLTAWYMLFMSISFAAGGGLALLSMRHSIHSTVDEQLRERMRVVRETIDRTLRVGNVQKLRKDLDEDSELRPESDLLQISDQAAKWVFQSAAMKAYHLPPQLTTNTNARAITEIVGDIPIRSITETTWVNGRAYHIQVAARMDEFYEALDRFSHRLLIFVPVILIVASAAGYWTSRRALSPVDQITQAAQQIHSQNLSSRIAVPKTHDELQRLSETLNAMLARVEAAMQKISQFTADASHELRTPITIMRTRAELVLRRVRTETEYRDVIEQLHAELVQTSDLVDNLMLLARADAGSEPAQFTAIDLGSILRRVLVQASPLAEGKGLTLRATLPETDNIWIEGDSQLLQRLFLLLIDNAVKYTPPGGRVLVELTGTDGIAQVSVSDTGIGIAATDLPYIFDRFYRADKTRSRESGGAGIGLSIGRWIAEAHLGSVDVKSRVGEGTTFFVILPKIETRSSADYVSQKS